MFFLLSNFLSTIAVLYPQYGCCVKYIVFVLVTSFASWQKGLLKQHRKNRVGLFEWNIKTIWWNISAMYILERSYHISRITCHILGTISYLEIISVGEKLESQQLTGKNPFLK